MKNVEVICGKCKQIMGEEKIPDSLWDAIEDRKKDLAAGLISKELFLFEMSCCMNNKIGHDYD